MTTKKDENKKFYKDKGFWAKICYLAAGLLAGEAGVVDTLGQIMAYFVGG